MKTQTGKSGFSLLELVITIVVLGLLAFVVIPKIGNIGENARIAAARKEMLEIQKAIMGDGQFRGYVSDNNGSLPSSLSLLTGDPSGYDPFFQTGNRGNYLSNADMDGGAADVLEDPWGNAYEWDSATGVLYSWGADEVDDGGDLADDIVLDVDG